MISQTKFTSSKQTSYSNALHTSFHTAQYNRIIALPAVDQTAWRIQPLLAAWKESIDVEVEINRETTASIETKTLQELDDKRDRVINLLFAIIKAESRFGLLESRLQAAQRLSLIAKTYNGLQTQAYREQTVHTNGLLTDLKKSQSFQDLKTLGLDAYLSQLQTLNDEFQQVIDKRSVTQAQTQLPSAKVQRKVTDEAYALIVERIKGAFAFCDTDAERERINLLVTLMNKVSDEHKARYNQATGQSSSSNKEGKEGKTVIPNSKGGTTTGDTGAQWADGTPKAQGE